MGGLLLRIEELQQRLREQRETEELHQQQQLQQQQRLAEAQQKAATAVADLEELRASQLHLAAKAAAAEAEQRRQQDLLDKRQVPYIAAGCRASPAALLDIILH